VGIGQENLFKGPQILGLIPQLQIRQFLRCASPQIANPQIFLIFLQIAKLQISTKFGTTMSQSSHKSRRLNDFCLLYTFELEQFICYVCEET
jgi:hypothetical protein